jgi:response regulator RpfG family c-di-GMP phosphodiesterase
LPENKRILIVDESPLICSIIKEAAKAYSEFECQSIPSAEEAINYLHEYRPDIVVAEVDLPGTNGYELVYHLREDKRWEPIPVILMAGNNSPDGMALAFNCGADDLILKPFDPVGLILKIKSIFRRMRSSYREAATALEKKTIRALGRSVEVKDTYTEGHSARVAFYGVIIAKAILLSEKITSFIEDAAYLHDLGKIGIREQILNKSGPLSPEEKEIMRTHPEKSAVIIDSLGFLPDIVPMVRHHHERYDGNGYPGSLKGDDIPLGSRVITVADSFDAMTSDRAFRKKRDITYALNELKENAGTQFDPQIANIFFMEIQKFPGIETLPNYTGAESLELLKLFKG